MKEYKFLKVGSMIFKVLSWVVLAISIAVGITILIRGGGMPITTPDGITVPPTPRAAGAIFVIMGAFYFLLLQTIGGIISILLDIKSSCCDKPAV